MCGADRLHTLLCEVDAVVGENGRAFAAYFSSALGFELIMFSALDNAIEGVERLGQPEKKTVRFFMAEREGMLHIEVENYYEGTVQFKNGVPVTSKQDAANHGIGVRSIRTLAQRYGGDIEINTEDQVFLLQIVIPLSA